MRAISTLSSICSVPALCQSAASTLARAKKASKQLLV
jgi:hypothetical protein